VTGMLCLDALRLTSIVDDEWTKGEKAATNFWDEIASESATRAKVIDVFKKCNSDMQKAGRPYRYS